MGKFSSKRKQKKVRNYSKLLKTNSNLWTNFSRRKSEIQIDFEIFYLKFLQIQISKTLYQQYQLIVHQQLTFINRKMHNFFDRHKLIEGQYKLSEIHVDYELGRGNSKVYKAMMNGINYALKQIYIRNDKQHQDFLKEVQVMKSLSKQCDSMIQFQGYFITKMQLNQYEQNRYAFMVMECAQMNLQQLITRRKDQDKRFKIWQIEKIIAFCLNAFKQLQDTGIAHCDIKPENILLVDVEKMELKLCDVGSCRTVSKQKQQQSTILGTVPFLAPELVSKNTKHQKMVSKNAFKSDVFSLGLVFLYLITFKKFKSNERLEIEPATYQQIVNDWIWEARQLGSSQISCAQIIKMALNLDQEKRPNFNQMLKVYIKQRQRRNLQIEKETGCKSDGKKSVMQKLTNAKSYQSTPSGQFAKSKALKKSIASKTSTNGFKLNKTKGQIQSPLRKKKDNGNISSSSPQKSIASFMDIYDLIFVTEQNKSVIPFETISTQQKTFVLDAPFVNFKVAQTVSLLKNCDLSIGEQLSQVRGTNLFIDYEVQGIGLSDQMPYQQFPKIFANFSQSSLLGGYRGIIKMLTWPKLQHLTISFSGSDATYDEIVYLLDRLSGIQTLQSLTFCWQKNHLMQEQHFNITEKISKLYTLKKLVMIMGRNFIECQKEMRWVFPKNLDSLFLQYPNNFIGKQVSNICVSFSTLKLKQLYVNLQNNSLGKGQIHMLFKAIISMEGLQKLIMKISYNALQELNYLSNVLLQNNSTNLTLLELEMHHINAKLDKILSLIDYIKQLFQFKLKHLKITCDRTIRTHSMKQKVEQLVNIEKLRVDVFGNSNDYFSVYIRKKQVNKNGQGSPNKQRRSSLNFKLDINGMASSAGNQIKSPLKKEKDRRSNLFTLVPSMTMHVSSPMIPIQLSSPLKKPTEPRNPVLSSSPIKQSAIIEGCCRSLYSVELQFENYQCLSCIQMKQVYKNIYFCNWCVENCLHSDHNLVKVYTRTRCSCAYSGMCQSFSAKTGSVCAQDLNIKVKKQFYCLKCTESFCLNCIQDCKMDHPKFVQQNKDPNSKDCIRYFECCGRRSMGGSSAFLSQRSIK